MNIRTSVGLVAGGLLALGMAAAYPAHAAPLPGFIGSTASSVAGCPYINWRLARTASGQLHGIAMYSDLSGISSVSGTSDADGRFTLVLTRTDIGNGPVGTVSGTATADGRIAATLVGAGCANNNVNIRPVRDLNDLVYMMGGGR
ncbi:MAG: hypothetical protein ACREFP_06280 [Acetobacteraceae bacterium]